MAEQVAVSQSRAGEHRVVGIEHTVGSTRLEARVGIGQPQQVGFIFAPQRVFSLTTTQHRLCVGELDFGIQAASGQVHQPAAVVVDPVLDPLIHLRRPVLGVGVQHQHAVRLERHPVEVQFGFAVQVVLEPLSLHPSQQSPFAGGQRRSHPAPDRRRDRVGLGDDASGCRPVKGQRGRGVFKRPRVGAEVAAQVLPRIDHRLGRQAILAEVVAASAELVVRVPGDGGGQDTDVGRGSGR